VLNDLANLNLDNRRILGDRQNVVHAVQKAKRDAIPEKNDSVKTAEESKIIQISSESEGASPRFLTPKAHKLNKLTKALSDATDNSIMARIVTDFVAVLQLNSSRTLTKEGFAFLDALYKQLADPSVFVMPLRTSRARNSDEEQSSVQEPRQVKLGVVARLRKEVEAATGNGVLAKMVADFGAVTNKSSGRTVTKDGFAFLEGLARKLKELD
jgi:ribosomal protein S19E (S16A)